MENPKKKPEFKMQVFRSNDGEIRVIVKCTSETITHPDGRQDVVIHAPNLNLINKALGLPINRIKHIKQEGFNG